MKFKAYGTSTPTEDSRPTHGRSSSLYDIKKSISYFMPNKNMQWNELTGVGNPTRLSLVNETIKKVKRFETRKQGAPSKARRPLKETEFQSIKSTLQQADYDHIVTKYGNPALLCFQFHMIGRLDDSCKWLHSNLSAHDVFPGKAGKAKLSWGKNVYEERDAPWQHLFGCLDPMFCVLINVGLWLEVFHTFIPDGRLRNFIFGFVPDAEKEEDTANRIKSAVYQCLRKVFKDLPTAVEDLIGTHSVRKFASTWVRSNGISCDDKDHRGGWKRKRVSDVYDDGELDYIDAKVAAVLSRSGVCHYLIDDDVVDKNFIKTYVTQVSTKSLVPYYLCYLERRCYGLLIWNTVIFCHHQCWIESPEHTTQLLHVKAIQSFGNLSLSLVLKALFTCKRLKRWKLTMLRHLLLMDLRL